MGWDVARALEVLALAALCSCAAVPLQRDDTPTPTSRPSDRASATVDFAGIEAWLDCASASGNATRCEQASANTLGGRIAGLAATTFGDESPPTPSAEVKSVEALVSRMKSWPDIVSRAERFFPGPVGGGALRVFVVANGHPWGDAYVRGVTGEGQALRLSEDGEPVIVLNAVLIASGYRGSPTEQAESALGVLSHEIFHGLFRRFRAKDPRWSAVSQSSDARNALQLMVLNEGVAHFLDREAVLMRDGFPPEKAEAALAGIAGAWRRLSSPTLTSAEGEKILQTANQGRYWEKYGSISGMLIAYGVFRAFGVQGIQDSVRCGPGLFLSRYAVAVERVPTLPRLPAEIDPSTWTDLCRAE